MLPPDGPWAAQPPNDLRTDMDKTNPTDTIPSYIDRLIGSDAAKYGANVERASPSNRMRKAA